MGNPKNNGFFFPRNNRFFPQLLQDGRPALLITDGLRCGDVSGSVAGETGPLCGRRGAARGMGRDWFEGRNLSTGWV